MIFYCVKLVSHFSISRLTVFVGDVNIVGKRGGIQTSRRYGVAANTKTTLGHPPLSDTIFYACARAPKEPWGLLKRCGVTWSDNTEGIPYGRTGNRCDSSFARRAGLHSYFDYYRFGTR